MSESMAPLYLKVKRHILANIGAGKWRPMSRVPSENEIVKTFGVSRMTANRALRELSDEGVLMRIAGVGTFVADRPARAHPLEVRNIAEEIRARGGTHGAAVVEQREVRASGELAAEFALAGPGALLHSLVIHTENGIPIQLEDRYVRPSVAPDYLALDLTRTTAHEHLMRVAPLQEAQHVLRATMPDARARKLLAMRTNEPCLLVLRKTWAGGKLASLARLLHPGSRYELSGRFRP